MGEKRKKEREKRGWEWMSWLSRNFSIWEWIGKKTIISFPFIFNKTYMRKCIWLNMWLVLSLDTNNTTNYNRNTNNM